MNDKSLALGVRGVHKKVEIEKNTDCESGYENSPTRRVIIAQKVEIGCNFTGYPLLS